MVTTQAEATSSTPSGDDSGRTFSKLRQIGTDLMSATGNGNLKTILSLCSLSPLKSGNLVSLRLQF